MARPRLDLGTFGDIRIYKLDNGKYSAETLFRDYDGKTRPVKRRGDTEKLAERNLKKDLARRQGQGGELLSASSYFAAAADLWIEEVSRKRRGSTYDTYRRNLRNRILPAFGDLKLSECSVQVVHRFLRQLEQSTSANYVRSCRTVLSGVLGMSAQLGAISANPVLGAIRIEGNAKPARALTLGERSDFLAKLDADKRAVADDLPDLLRYMLGTGVRIGEVCGLRWIRVDLDEGITVHGDNLVPVTGKGLVLQKPKTPSGFRVLPLPDFVLTMLRVRYPGERYQDAPVFPACIYGSRNGHRAELAEMEYRAGRWRDPHNVSRSIRKFRDSHPEYAWFTSHVLRKTAITIMDQAGLSAREIAGYAGHARPSITQDVYMDKRLEDRKVSEAIQRAMGPVDHA